MGAPAVVNLAVFSCWSVTVVAVLVQYLRRGSWKLREDEDAKWLALARKARGTNDVACIVPLGRRDYVLGASAQVDVERVFGERGASAEIAALRKLCEKRRRPALVETAYVVSRSKEYRTGLACREFLLASEFFTRSTRLVFFSESEGCSKKVTLGELLPHSRADWTSKDFAVYARLAQEPIATQFSTLRREHRDLAFRCYEAAAQTVVTNGSEGLLRFGAAVLFDDGSLKSAQQWHTPLLDPVFAVAPFLERRRKSRFVVLCVVDSWGVAHAPFALGRSILLDLGIAHKTFVCLHDDGLRVRLVPALDLVPHTPLLGKNDDGGGGDVTRVVVDTSSSFPVLRKRVRALPKKGTSPLARSPSTDLPRCAKTTKRGLPPRAPSKSFPAPELRSSSVVITASWIAAAADGDRDSSDDAVAVAQQ
mmetsp:Transcript_14501/g.43945  ORF Transcript_14501/g.43945 Transcript_14501/m.43945 type:complete len:422 (-) Transcript_14501:987-2252(-)